MAMQVRIRGVVYPSIKDAAKEFNTSASRVTRMIDLGREDDIPDMSARAHGKVLIIKGVKYNSMNIAASALGVSMKTVRAHAEMGTLDKIGQGKQGKEIEYNGVTYPSVQKAAIELGISREAVKRNVSVIKQADGSRLCRVRLPESVYAKVKVLAEATDKTVAATLSQLVEWGLSD